MPGPCQVNNNWLEPAYYTYPCLNVSQIAIECRCLVTSISCQHDCDLHPPSLYISWLLDIRDTMFNLTKKSILKKNKAKVTLAL